MLDVQQYCHGPFLLSQLSLRCFTLSPDIPASGHTGLQTYWPPDILASRHTGLQTYRSPVCIDCLTDWCWLILRKHSFAAAAASGHVAVISRQQLMTYLTPQHAWPLLFTSAAPLCFLSLLLSLFLPPTAGPIVLCLPDGDSSLFAVLFALLSSLNLLTAYLYQTNAVCQSSRHSYGGGGVRHYAPQPHTNWKPIK